MKALFCLALLTPAIGFATLITCGDKAVCDNNQCEMLGGSPQYFQSHATAAPGLYSLVKVSVEFGDRLHYDSARCWYNDRGFYFRSREEYPIIPVYDTFDEWVGSARYKLCDPEKYDCYLEIIG